MYEICATTYKQLGKKMVFQVNDMKRQEEPF